VYYPHIPSERCTDFSALKECGFSPAVGFPIARMKLNWNSFDGYIASLKSKKRYNIRQKCAKLEAPEITVRL